MISQNHPDEGMLSDRNEQDLFNSDRNSQDGFSDQSISDGDLGDQDDNPTENVNYGEQSSMKQTDEQKQKKKKEVKATYIENLKGYMGFGTQLRSQKIGSVFFFPILSSWTFKFQVITTQIIIGMFAFAIFFAFRYAGNQSTLSTMQSWIITNYFEQQLIMFRNINSTFTDILDVSIQESFQLLNQSNYVMIQQFDYYPKVNLTWPSNKTVNLSGNIMKENQEEMKDDNQYYSQITYEYATYHILNNKSYDQKMMNFIMNINYVVPILYNKTLSIICSISWKFNDIYLLIYPGVVVKNVSAFVKKIDGTFENSDFFNNTTTGNKIHPVTISNNLPQIFSTFTSSEYQGSAYADLSISKIENLFNLMLINQKSKIILLMLDNNHIILNNVSNLTGKCFDEQNIILNLTTNDVKEILSFNPSDIQILRRIQSEKARDISVFSFTYAPLGIRFIMIQNNSDIEIYELATIKKFQTESEQLQSVQLVIYLSLPLVMMLISLFLLIRWIKPMEQITEIADMQLKKNLKIHQEELNKINGDGLINQLTTLFKALITSFNQMKHDNKNQLCNYYSQQTYPKNLKKKDLQKIRDQIEIIKDITLPDNAFDQSDMGTKFYKLIPNQQE